ncbi:hypothetical protein [Calycomorphotria hydatis]|uniref:Uncharacterized protein n=1 Tax=Calycomorphotria hydatis TaxID=2528027 RepID=A0A517TEF7_9PLAN|nr:hypothetical protein [Calycomorphotria hydatis]QDT66758.1 hypothetical protein V22_40290 [Calycomorphotria hydatis]
MFQLTFSLTIVCSLLCASAASAEDLFSSTRISSPFGTPVEQKAKQQSKPPVTTQPQAPQTTAPSQPQAVTLVELEQFATAAGYEAKRNDSFVSFVVTSGKWDLPVAVSIENANLVRFAIPLRTFSANQTLSGQQAMSILALNEQHRPASFSYQTQSRRLDLQLFLPKTVVNANSMKAALTKLAGIAAGSDSTWNATIAPPQQQAQAQPQTQQQQSAQQVAQGPDRTQFGTGSFGMRTNQPKPQTSSKPYWELDKIGSAPGRK